VAALELEARKLRRQYDQMKSLTPTICLFAAALLWTGCTTAQVQAVRHTATHIEPKEAIAIVFSRDFSLDGRPIDEKEIVTCISDEMRKAHPSLRIVLPNEFRHTAFPDLAPEAAPNTPESLALLLDHAAFRDRIASLRIRYLVSVQGRTDSKYDGGVECGGGPGGAACIGLLSWDRKSNLTASILDLKQVRAAGELKVLASGRPWFFFVFPSPLMIGAPAFTESKACGELGQALGKFLAGERPAEPEEGQK